MITCTDETKGTSSSNGACELIPCEPCHGSAYKRVLEAKALHEGVRHETLCHSIFKVFGHDVSQLARRTRPAEHDRPLVMLWIPSLSWAVVGDFTFSF